MWPMNTDTICIHWLCGKGGGGSQLLVSSIIIPYSLYFACLYSLFVPFNLPKLDYFSTESCFFHRIIWSELQLQLVIHLSQSDIPAQGEKMSHNQILHTKEASFWLKLAIRSDSNQRCVYKKKQNIFSQLDILYLAKTSQLSSENGTFRIVFNYTLNIYMYYY